MFGSENKSPLTYQSSVGKGRSVVFWCCWCLPGRSREVMEVGEAAAAAAADGGGLGAHIDLCHFSVAPSTFHVFLRYLSLSSLLFTLHTNIRAHTQTHTHTETNRFRLITERSPLQCRYCHHG